MHILQSKHTRLNEEEAVKLLSDLNISRTQLPKISSTDAALPEGCVTGDIIKLERKDEDGFVLYYRIVV